MSPKKRLVDFHEASARWGIGYWSVWRAAEAGYFKTVRLGDRRLIPESEVERVLEDGFGPQEGRGRRRARPKAMEAADAGVQ